MKRRNTSSFKSRKKSKKYKSEGCNSVFHNISQFKHHVKTNIPCRLKLKYCCDFCGYIGYDSDGLQRHLTLVPTCQQCYKEKQATTGLLPDLSVGKDDTHNSTPNTTSYQYKTYSATGIQNNINLNLTDSTLANKNFATQLLELNLMKEATTEDGGFMKISRIISSITNENLPFVRDIDNHVTDSGNGNDISDANDHGNDDHASDDVVDLTWGVRSLADELASAP